MSKSIHIRILESSTEMKLVQLLEEEVWGANPIPIHQTITAVKNGGLMLGAFYDDELVGFSYSFAGFHQGQSYLCSHMLGIHPNYQVKGIGAMLKDEQKKAASKLGYQLITWTFDPLESRNAYLNLSKLRAICSTYVENCYGEMEDGLNSGLPTDRFQVEWWINSKHVFHRAESFSFSHESTNFKWMLTEHGLPKLETSNTDFTNFLKDDEPIFIPVPASFQEVKRKNPHLAIDWRMKSREIFQTLFAKGYAAVALKKIDDSPIHYYVLQKRNKLELR